MNHNNYPSMLEAYFAAHYGYGLLVTLGAAAFGLWLSVRAVRGRSWILEGRVRLPKWILFALAALLQVPVIIYVLVGEYTGAFAALFRVLN